MDKMQTSLNQELDDCETKIKKLKKELVLCNDWSTKYHGDYKKYKKKYEDCNRDYNNIKNNLEKYTLYNTLMSNQITHFRMIIIALFESQKIYEIIHG